MKQMKFCQYSHAHNVIQNTFPNDKLSSSSYKDPNMWLNSGTNKSQQGIPANSLQLNQSQQIV